MRLIYKKKLASSFKYVKFITFNIYLQKIYFLWAKNAYLKGSQSLDPFEFIHPELKTEKELRQELASGAIIDGLLLTALSFRRLKISSTL